MKAEFSEFSYGFALAFEIMNALYPNASGVPFFPSLQQEASKGFDVDFTTAGWPLFLQFKLAEYLTRRAKYLQYYGGPYYRVAIHRRKDSRQHNLLKNLTLRESEVYYVAPAFRHQSDFNRLFVSGEIFNKTAFFPLNGLPSLTDDLQHYITFDTSATVPSCQWHSDEIENFHPLLTGQQWLDRIRGLMEHPRELGWQFLYDLYNILVEILREQISQPELFDVNMPTIQVDEHSALVREVQNLLATYFGVILIILQPSI